MQEQQQVKHGQQEEQEEQKKQEKQEQKGDQNQQEQQEDKERQEKQEQKGDLEEQEQQQQEQRQFTNITQFGLPGTEVCGAEPCDQTGGPKEQEQVPPGAFRRFQEVDQGHGGDSGQQ